MSAAAVGAPQRGGTGSTWAYWSDQLFLTHFCENLKRRFMTDLEHQLDIFLGKQPVFGQGVFVAPGAVVIGDVTLGDYSSVWFYSVLRADINRIVVGHHTNIQDHCVLHMADEMPCVLGNYVTVGHGAIVHASTIGDEVLVGMGSVILDGAVIGEQSLVGARAVVTPGTKIPPGSLVLGTPAQVVRELSATERKQLRFWAEKYVNLAQNYAHKAETSGVPPS